MSTSIAESFRTQQAVQDLRILAARSPAEQRARLVARIPNMRVTSEEALTALAALAEGHDAPIDQSADIMTALQLAATQPQDDFPTFLLATYLVLDCVLAGRLPVRDISDHWSTFRGHYRAAAAVERAAIAQAIRRISLLQDKPISMPETTADRTTAATASLKPQLEAHLTRRLKPAKDTEPEAVAAVLLEAFSDPSSVRDVAALWAENGEAFLISMPDPVLAGFRHVYETWDGFSPDGAAQIPLLDPPPGVDWPF